MKLFGKEISRKNRYLVTPTAAITVIIILSLLVVRPALGQVLRLRAENEAEARRLERIEEKIDRLQAIDEAELEQSVKLATAALPPEKNVIQPLFTISQLAAENGAFIESLQVTPGELATESAETSERRGQQVDFEQPALTFRISLIGAREGLKSFLAAVNQTLPLMRLEGANLDTLEVRELREREEILGDFKLQLDLITFYSPFPTTLGRPESDLAFLSEEEELALAKLADFRLSQLASFPPGAGSSRVNPFSF